MIPTYQTSWRSYLYVGIVSWYFGIFLRLTTYLVNTYLDYFGVLPWNKGEERDRFIITLIVLQYFFLFEKPIIIDFVYTMQKAFFFKCNLTFQ